MVEDDELFGYLEGSFRSDRAVALLKELRGTFTGYMTELAEQSAQAKASVALELQPDLDPGVAAALAHTSVMADAILTAVAVHLARETA
jgi:hypothetical protein